MLVMHPQRGAITSRCTAPLPPTISTEIASGKVCFNCNCNSNEKPGLGWGGNQRIGGMPWGERKNLVKGSRLSKSKQKKAKQRQKRKQCRADQSKSKARQEQSRAKQKQKQQQKQRHSRAEQEKQSKSKSRARKAQAKQEKQQAALSVRLLHRLGGTAGAAGDGNG